MEFLLNEKSLCGQFQNVSSFLYATESIVSDQRTLDEIRHLRRLSRWSADHRELSRSW